MASISEKNSVPSDPGQVLNAPKKINHPYLFAYDRLSVKINRLNLKMRPHHDKPLMTGNRDSKATDSSHSKRKPLGNTYRIFPDAIGALTLTRENPLGSCLNVDFYL
jgi:hypothetical protein